MSVVLQKTLQVATPGRGCQEITAAIQALVAKAGINTGLCHVFIHHTSASLMLSENADPDVLLDLETLMARIAPDGDPAYRHRDEGPDDMPAHIRSVLTQTGLTIPVNNGRCALGTWQGVYIWEHRTAPHQRQLTVTISS